MSNRALVILTIFVAPQIFALTCTGATGKWNTIGTWTSAGNCNRVPTTADSVVVPNGITVTLDVNTAAIVDINVNAGGTLVGDGTGKALLVAGAGSPDVTNNGTIDFSGVVGVAGSSNAAVMKGNGTAIDYTQTAGSGAVWKFSTIDFASAGATFANISQIEFNGHGSPFQNTTVNITNSSTTPCNYVFSGSVGQTLTSANMTRLTGSTTKLFSSTNSPGSLTVTNTSATGLTLQATASLTGSLLVDVGATFTLSGTTTAMPTVSGTKSFDPTSTVNYAGSSTQTVTKETYGDLTVSVGGTKTVAAGPITILGDLTIGTGATWSGTTNNPAVSIGGNFSGTGTFTSGTGIYTFNGTAPQLWSNFTTVAGSIVIANSSSTGVTIRPTVAITKSLTVNAGAVLTLGDTIVGTTPMPTAVVSRTFSPTSLVVYGGSGSQAVAPLTYGSLTLQGGGTDAPAAGTIVVAGDFILNSGTTFSGNTNNPTVSFAGDFTNSGTFNSGTGIYTFNGTSMQNFTGTTTINKVQLNNTALGVNGVLNLSGNLIVPTNLTFASGRILTNSSKVIIPSGGVVNGAAAGTGWVAGNLEKFVAAGSSSPTFEVGTNGSGAPSLAYSPINLTFVGVGGAGGYLTAFAVLGNHSQIANSGLDPGQGVNRWWSLNTSGATSPALPSFTSYSAIFNFLTADLDVGTATTNLFVNRWSGSVWSVPIMGTRTATSTQITTVAALGEFAIAQPMAQTVTKTSTVISDPVNGGTNPKRIPGAIIEYTITASTDANAVAPSTLVVVTDDLSGAGSLTYLAGSLFIDGIAEDDDAVNGGTSNPDVGNFNSGSKIVTGTLGTINAGASKSVKFRVTVN